MSMGIGFIHFQLLNQNPLGAVDKTNFLHLFFYRQIICCHFTQPLPSRDHPFQALTDCAGRKWYLKRKYAMGNHALVHFLIVFGSEKQENNGVRAVTGINRKSSARIIRKRRIDDNKIKVTRQKLPAGSSNIGTEAYRVIFRRRQHWSQGVIKSVLIGNHQHAVCLCTENQSNTLPSSGDSNQCLQ